MSGKKGTGNNQHGRPPVSSDIVEMVAKLLHGGDPRLTVFLGGLDIAEKAIHEAKERYPLATNVLDRSFMLLKPPEVLFNTLETTYPVHCAELLDRVATGEDTRPATDAECVAVFHSLSLNSPLKHHAVCIYRDLFVKLFPEAVERVWGKDPERFGQTDVLGEELLADIRRKLTVPERRFDS